jgi:hypothetical protein
MCATVRMPSDGSRTLRVRLATKRASWFTQEITMTNEKTSGPPTSGGMAMLGRLGRFSLFLVTAGFAYPNVFVENVDFASLDAKHKINTKKL